MKYRFAATLVLLFSLAAATALLLGQRPPRPGPGAPGPGVGQQARPGGPGMAGEFQRGPQGRDGILRAFALAARYLELTDEQKSTIREAFEATREAGATVREQLRVVQEDLREALSATTPDPATVGTLAIQMHELRSQLRAQRQALAEIIKGVLTPDQLDKLATVEAAAPLEPLIHAFRLLGLIDPPAGPADNAPELP